jgi:hypothetical protein
MPDLKEPRFLAADMRPAVGHEREPREIGYPVTIEEYLALFDGAAPDQRVGEASAFYLWSNTAAQAIADLQPQGRIIAMLREPVGFLRSLHLMFQRWGVETERDLQRATSPELEGARRVGREVPRRSHRPQLLQYAEHVDYVPQLQRYHQHFPSEQILTLIYDDYLADNGSTITEVLRFLDVDEHYRIETNRVNVTTRTVRSQRLKLAVNQLTQGQGPVVSSARSLIKSVTPPRMRRKSLRAVRHRVVMTEPESLDDDCTAALRMRFAPRVHELSEFLDRDLVTLWGYS